MIHRQCCRRDLHCWMIQHQLGQSHSRSWADNINNLHLETNILELNSLKYMNTVVSDIWNHWATSSTLCRTLNSENYLKHKKILLKWSNIITNVLRVTKKAPVNGQSRSQSCKTIKSRCEDWNSLQHEIYTVNIDLLGGNSSYRWIFQQNVF